MVQTIEASASPIPAVAGLGLRFPHHRCVIETTPSCPWFEVHPENYMADGVAHRDLETIRRDRPISFHAVGLSLGGVDPLDLDHLRRLRRMIDHFQPGLVSDHLSWSAIDGVFLADLLPLPYTEEALAVATRNVDHAQSALGRPILIENPSTYLVFRHSTMTESEFLAELVDRTGCGILLDVNNLYLSAANHGWDTRAYLDALPAAAIGEFHLAGHAVKPLADGGQIRIDDHGSAVSPEVWALFAETVARFGKRPSLIEWDTDIPEFSVLEAEAARAQAILDGAQGASPCKEARHA